VSIDLIDRIRAAGEALEARPPDPRPAIRAGRRRITRRTLALATSMCLVAAGTAWAFASLGSLRHEPPSRIAQTPTPPPPSLATTSFQAFWGVSVPIPEGWYADAPDPELSAGFSVATSPGGVAGPLHSPAIGPADAWLTVYVPGIQRGCEISCEPFPDPLTRDDLHVLTEHDGAPLFERWGGWSRSEIGLMFWVGPEASQQTRADADMILASLHIPAPEPSASLLTYTDPHRKFTIEYPDDWTHAEDTLTPHLSSPAEIFAAGTYRLRAGGESCWHFPVNAMEDLGPTDALVWIAEARPFGGHYPRPESFPGEPPDQEMDARYCLQNPDKAYTQWWIAFSQDGRSFYVLVAMGNDATDERRAETWRILDSFAPEPDPSFSPKAGQPTK